MGGFQVSREKEEKTGPGLVFVQGGTFTMGATQEDVMADWNNIPRRITVNSFYIDRSEVANIHYREYMYWVNTVFDGDEYQAVRTAVLPIRWCGEASWLTMSRCGILPPSPVLQLLSCCGRNLEAG